MKKLFKTILILAVAYTTTYGQSVEIVNAIVMEDQRKDPDTDLVSGFWRAEDMIDDNGRFYIKIDNCNENFHTVYDDIVDMEPINTFSFNGVYDFRASLLLEYTPGVGITDNTIINYSQVTQEIAIDGDIIATSYSSRALSFDNKIYLGDTIQGADLYYYISVYDKLNDTLLYNFNPPSNSNAWYETALELDDDYLYVGTTFKHDGLVMFGDTLHHLVDDFIQFTTVLQKVNWRTGELLWTRYTGSLEREDTVRKIKVLDDGNIMVEMEVSGPFSYEGVELDPPNYRNLEVEYYNLVFAKFTEDGDYIDHVHLRNPNDNAFKYTEIENDGSFFVSGIDITSNGIFVGEDEIAVYEEKKSTGLLFSFDNDLSLKWHKTYYCNSDDGNNGISTVFGVNEIDNGEVLCAILHLDTTYLDDVLYINENEGLDISQNMIVHYSHTGEILSDPIPFGINDRIFDFQQLGEDHYLFFVEYRGYPNLNFKLNLFGIELEDASDPYNMIFELKGNVFESITAVNELLSASDLAVYPNPCRQGQDMTIKMNDELRSASFREMTICNYNGQLEYSRILEGDQDFYIKTSNLSSGPKIVTITTENKIFKQSIIIK